MCAQAEAKEEPHNLLELKKQNLGSQRGKNLQSRAQRGKSNPEKAFQRCQFFNLVLINTFVWVDYSTLKKELPWMTKKKKILWARKDWADSVCPPVIAENLYCKGHQAECSEGHWHIKENNLLWADGWSDHI